MCSRVCEAFGYRQAGLTFVVRLDRVFAVDLDPPCSACAEPPNYYPIRKTVCYMTQRIVTPYRRRFLVRVRPFGELIFRATDPPRIQPLTSRIRL